MFNKAALAFTTSGLITIQKQRACWRPLSCLFLPPIAASMPGQW